MRLMRVGEAGSERPAVLLDDGRALDVTALVGDIGPGTLGRDRLRRLADDVRTQAAALPALDLAAVRVGPPVARIGKIVCVGLNYRAHAAETGQAAPEEPILFMKASDTVVGARDEVSIPPRSRKTDYEVELAIVIGATASYLPGDDAALAAIAGYAVSNDVSEREFQLERGGQWDKGKNCATFNPLGPWLVTADEVPDPQALELWLNVNGEQRQRSSTDDMIFGVAHIVRYVSQFMTLRPGDVINTGTPQGVGMGFEPTRFLDDGDVVELGIAGLGKQRQTFRRLPAPVAA